ncbi:MAG: helix-turn-helix transcriptional regulator [Tannerella sp.]|nr:helix-turn-helix transcriptional regulator [Tannerella sp.]
MKFKNAVVSFQKFQNEMLLVELDHSRFGVNVRDMMFSSPTRYEALMLMGVMQGELKLSIDYIPHLVPQNGIVWIMPTHITQLTSITHNFKCWMLLVSKSFMAENGRPIQHATPLISYMQLKKKPFTIFEPDEFQSLCESLQVLKKKIGQETHLFHKDMIINTLRGFMLDMGNFFFSKKENIFSPVLTRSEEIFESFLVLLTKHCKEQHDVTFYAEKLFITPQYLSLTLKKQSGRSASQWIQDALMVEAKGLLNIPRITIQEIAHKLHFPDQSTFGKFFKKHTGLSPIAFRKLKV